MSLLTRTVAPSRQRSFIPDIPAPSSASGGEGYAYLTRDALRIAAVVACVGLRSGAFAQMPIKGYADIEPSARLLDVQPDLLRAPSEVVVPSVHRTQMSISRDVWGYAVGIITAVDGAGYPAHAEWMDPDIVRVRQSEMGGRLDWWIGNEPFDRSRILHIPSRWVLPGRPLGICPLEYSGLVDLAKMAQDFGRDWFRNGAVPSSILYSDKEIDSDQADRILAKVKERWRKRQPAVIGAGMKWEQVQVAPNEAQFLETIRQTAADIAISYNLPPEKIAAAVSGSSITYANREQNTQDYLVDSINPDLVVVQESYERHMRPGTIARFNTGALLRSDLKTRYDAYRIGIAAKFITPNEARAVEDMPPLTPDEIAAIPAVGAAAPMPGA